jgi:hypothetical protein
MSENVTSFRHGDRINAPLALLFNMTLPWPFDMWGFDVIGAIKSKAINGHRFILVAIDYFKSKAINGHRFILVAIDYFTKWVEASSYVHVAQNMVKRFIKKNMIFSYNMPTRMITNNTYNFNSKLIVELCTKWKINHLNSSPYKPKMNGAVEAANKNLKKIIRKMMATYKD